LAVEEEEQEEEAFWGREKKAKKKQAKRNEQANPCNSNTAPTKLPTLHFAGSPGTSTHPLPIERAACPTEAAGPLLVFSTYKAFYG